MGRLLGRRQTKGRQTDTPNLPLLQRCVSTLYRRTVLRALSSGTHKQMAPRGAICTSRSISTAHFDASMELAEPMTSLHFFHHPGRHHGFMKVGLNQFIKAMMGAW